MLLTGTWLDYTGNTELIEASPSNSFDDCTYTNRKGGITVIYKNIFNCKSLSFDSYTFEYLSLVINSVSPPILLLIIYHPRRLKRGFLEETGELFSQITSKFDCIVISCDFNIYVKSSNNSDTKQFIRLLEYFDFKHVTGPTYATCHTLHHFFFKQPHCHSHKFFKCYCL